MTSNRPVSDVRSPAEGHPILLRSLRFWLQLRLEGGVDQRLALDVALANQPQSEPRTGERENCAKHEDLIQPVEEPLFRRVASHVLRPGRKTRDRLAQVPRGRGFD